MNSYIDFASLLAEKIRSTMARKQIKMAPAKTELQQNCALDLTSVTPSCFSHSGIICTIGPTSKDVRTLERMMEAGMTICRLNISHATHKDHEEMIANIRQAEMNYSKTLGYKYPVAIALDTRGPEIRTGILEGGSKKTLFLKEGEQFKLSSDKAYYEKGNYATVFIDFDISKIVKPGKIIFLDHGKISLEVTSTGPANVVTNVVNGGELGSNKYVKLDGILPDLPNVSERDKEDLKFAVKHDLEIIMVSLANNADVLNQIRTFLGPQGRKLMIIAKIQTKEGLRNIRSISEFSDGVMFCRNDLVMELQPIQVLLAQKFVTAFCHKIKKPIICSAEILDSMAKMPIPTLNEIADLSTSLADGMDCAVLTLPTSSKNYVVESVMEVKKIFVECDHILWQRSIFEGLKIQNPIPLNLEETVALMAVEESILCLAAAIIVMTTSGHSAHLISKYKPHCPLIVVSTYLRVARQCNLYRGIISLQYTGEPMLNWEDEVDARAAFALRFAQEGGFVSFGDPVIIVTGWKHGPTFANAIRTIYVSER